MLLHKREHNPFLQFFIQLFTISSVRNSTIFHMDRVGGILSLLIVIVVGKRLCFYRLFVSEPGSWEWGMQKGVSGRHFGMPDGGCGMCLRASAQAEHLGTKRIPRKSFSG